MKRDQKTTAILTALRKIMRAVDLHSRHLAQTVGLSGPQLVLLDEISGKEELSVKELADRVNLSSATVTDILNRLERRALVVRRRHTEDRRRVMVTITPEGRQAADKAPPLLQEQFVEKLSKLEVWEQTQILATLERVGAMMEAQHLDASSILESSAVSPSEAEEVREVLNVQELPSAGHETITKDESKVQKN